MVLCVLVFSSLSDEIGGVVYPGSLKTSGKIVGIVCPCSLTTSGKIDGASCLGFLIRQDTDKRCHVSWFSNKIW